ncbi:MAG: hypothetical protein EZS28_013364, partial [Streblomastix strix]
GLAIKLKSSCDFIRMRKNKQFNLVKPDVDEQVEVQANPEIDGYEYATDQ